MSASEDRVITETELALHRKKADMWVAIHGDVYDITTFVDEVRAWVLTRPLAPRRRGCPVRAGRPGRHGAIRGHRAQRGSAGDPGQAPDWPSGGQADNAGDQEEHAAVVEGHRPEHRGKVG